MEDCKINYDLTVRSATGSIIQFLYGEDGMSATKLENHSFKYINMDKVQLEDHYLFREDDIIKNIFRKNIFDKLTKDTKWVSRALEYYKSVIDDREYLITIIRIY